GREHEREAVDARPPSAGGALEPRHPREGDGATLAGAQVGEEQHEGTQERGQQPPGIGEAEALEGTHAAFSLSLSEGGGGWSLASRDATSARTANRCRSASACTPSPLATLP